MFPFGRPMPSGPYKQNFHAYEAIYMSTSQDHKVQEIDKGGKIILPMSALDILSRLEVQYPILFELTNVDNTRTTNAGVLEFNAEEGRTYLPNWMMRNLGLHSGGLVSVKNVALPAGQFAKFEPQSVDFLDISNPRAVLEKALRQFACLSEDDTITLYYNDKEYDLRIVETKPHKAISIIECDLSVDFALPVGYVEPERQLSGPTNGVGSVPPVPTFAAPLPAGTAVDDKGCPIGLRKDRFSVFSGKGQRADGKSTSTKGKWPVQPAGGSNEEGPSAVAGAADGEVPYIRGRLHFTRGDPLSVSSVRPEATAGSPSDMDDSGASDGPGSDFQAFQGPGRKLQ